MWDSKEDQLRIISMQRGGDIQAVSQLSESLEFAIDKNLGVLTSYPANIGTGIRASVHIKLPKLAKQLAQLESLAKDHHLQIRGRGGEHTDSVEPIFDLSNKRRLVLLTEVGCVNDLVVAVKAIIAAEKSL